MQTVTMFKCGFCGDLFSSRVECRRHEERHRKSNIANEMLEAGESLKAIQDATGIFPSVPAHLADVNKDHCFVIEYWQCCKKPAYRITSISHDGTVYVGGIGDWMGEYGSWLELSDEHLEDPRPAEELFVAEVIP